jgi:hypothetical protein
MAFVFTSDTIAFFIGEQEIDIERRGSVPENADFTVRRAQLQRKIRGHYG